MTHSSHATKTSESNLLSPLVFGAWRLLNQSDTATSDSILDLIRFCQDQGITSFDHADIYGDYQVEAAFGQALSRHSAIRSEIQLISKAGIKLISKYKPQHRLKSYDTRARHLIESVEASLRNLQTDYLDLFLIHRPDPLMDFDETASALKQLVDSGKVRAVGVSNFSTWQFEALQSRLDLALFTNQIEISPLELSAFNNGTLVQCQNYGIRPMAWSPFAGGELFGDSARAKRVRQALNQVAEAHQSSLTQIVIAWLCKHPSRIIPIIGTMNRERIAQLAEAVQLEMNHEDWFQIYQAALGCEVP